MFASAPTASPTPTAPVPTPAPALVSNSNSRKKEEPANAKEKEKLDKKRDDSPSTLVKESVDTDGIVRAIHFGSLVYQESEDKRTVIVRDDKQIIRARRLGAIAFFLHFPSRVFSDHFKITKNNISFPEEDRLILFLLAMQTKQHEGPFANCTLMKSIEQHAEKEKTKLPDDESTIAQIRQFPMCQHLDKKEINNLVAELDGLLNPWSVNRYRCYSDIALTYVIFESLLRAKFFSLQGNKNLLATWCRSLENYLDAYIVTSRTTYQVKESSNTRLLSKVLQKDCLLEAFKALKNAISKNVIPISDIKSEEINKVNVSDLKALQLKVTMKEKYCHLEFPISWLEQSLHADQVDSILDATLFLFLLTQKGYTDFPEFEENKWEKQFSISSLFSVKLNDILKAILGAIIPINEAYGVSYATSKLINCQLPLHQDSTTQANFRAWLTGIKFRFMEFVEFSVNRRILLQNLAEYIKVHHLTQSIAPSAPALEKKSDIKNEPSAPPPFEAPAVAAPAAPALPFIEDKKEENNFSIQPSENKAEGQDAKLELPLPVVPVLPANPDLPSLAASAKIVMFKEPEAKPQNAADIRVKEAILNQAMGSLDALLAAFPNDNDFSKIMRIRNDINNLMQSPRSVPVPVPVPVPTPSLGFSADPA